MAPNWNVPPAVRDKLAVAPSGSSLRSGHGRIIDPNEELDAAKLGLIDPKKRTSEELLAANELQNNQENGRPRGGRSKPVAHRGGQRNNVLEIFNFEGSGQQRGHGERRDAVARGLDAMAANTEFDMSSIADLTQLGTLLGLTGAGSTSSNTVTS